METGTKERILEEALRLFAKGGYMGTSMSDIAGQLGITKAALYKHYTNKQEILDSILAKMRQMDASQAREYEMPADTLAEAEEEYHGIPVETIGIYTKAMFLYWTKEEFSSDFRKMLTLEQYRDPGMAQLYQMYLAAGPVGYMTDVFQSMTDSEEDAHQLALDLYGPLFLLYSVYDAAQEKEEVIHLADSHIDRFISRLQELIGKENGGV